MGLLVSGDKILPFYFESLSPYGHAVVHLTWCLDGEHSQLITGGKGTQVCLLHKIPDTDSMSLTEKLILSFLQASCYQ